ncbi:MAG TPA: type 4a pilus biogenesis protein PilO [Gaiellaceae bacterium]|jgi:type IV pilus assembly protein PilO|nr:type 4a pilus biogenesis protein PilO [Gaiellaceae bacterium]
MKRRPSRGAVIALIVVGVLAYAAAGFFLVISPQRGKAEDLKTQIGETQAQIDQYRLLNQQARTTPPIRVADLFRLEKAMPNEVDMAGIVLELSRIAHDSGIEFESITPQGSTAGTGYQVLPVTLVFDGNYFELSDFLYRLRSLVRVRSGHLSANGRLFVVDSISFSESEQAFPRIQATLSVQAFVFGDTPIGAPAPAAPPPPAAGTTTTETTTTPAPGDGATTTTTTTTTEPAPAEAPPSAGASAAGAPLN